MGSNIKDVAAYAGISIATVSRAVSTPGRASASALACVQVAMDALHYHPNVLSRQLCAERTGLLGMALSSLASPAFTECMQGIEEAASITGQHAMLITTVYNHRRETRIAETILEQRVDGLILTVDGIAANPHLDHLDAERMPHVLVYNNTVGRTHIPARCCVTIDNRAAARDATRALPAQGRHQIHMPTGTPTVSNRMVLHHSGYREALEAAGIAPQPPVRIDLNAGATLPAELTHPLAPLRPTTILCSNDHLVLLTIRSLREMSLCASEDVSVVGFDDLAMRQWLSPTLATVAQPHRRVGTGTITVLACRTTSKVVFPITLPHRLLASDTSARAPVEAPLSVVSSPTSDTQGASR